MCKMMFRGVLKKFIDAIWITLVCNRALRQVMDDEGFCVSLKALRVRLRNKNVGDFEKYRSCFCDAVKELDNEVRRFAEIKKMEVSEALEMSVAGLEEDADEESKCRLGILYLVKWLPT